jgi:hypothetical protein
VLNGACAFYGAVMLYAVYRVMTALVSVSNLKLQSIYPFSTPGLLAMSRILKSMAVLGLIITFLASSTLLLRYHIKHSALGLALSAFFLALAFSSVALVGLTAQYQLQKPAERRLRAELATIAEQMEQPATQILIRNLEQLFVLDALASLYDQMRTAGRGYVDNAIFATYAATVLGIGVQLFAAYTLS